MSYARFGRNKSTPKIGVSGNQVEIGTGRKKQLKMTPVFSGVFTDTTRKDREKMIR